MSAMRSRIGASGLEFVVAVVGGALIVVGSFLEWFGRNYHPTEGESSFGGFDVPAKFLLDTDSSPGKGGFKLGLVVLVLGLVVVVGAVGSRTRPLIWAGAALALLVVVLYVVHLNDLTDKLNQPASKGNFSFGNGGLGVRNTIGLGAVLTGVGAVAALVSPALPWVQARLAERPEESASTAQK